MRGTACLLLTVLLLLALAPQAQAGTADAPEVSDPSGDAAACDPLVGSACTPSQANQADLDVTAAWVDVPDDTHIALHMQLAGAPAVVGASASTTIPGVGCFPTEASKVYDLNFRSQDPTGAPLVTADPNNGGAEINALFVEAAVACDTATSDPNTLGFTLQWSSPGTGSNALSTMDVDGSIAGSVLTWVLDRAAPVVMLPIGAAAGGFRVGDLVGNTYVTARVASVGFTDPPFAPDRAPDDGTGLPFQFTAAPSVLYQDVSTPDFALAAKNPDASNLTYVYNWTATQGDLDLSYAVAGTAGKAQVTVRDSGNATVFNKTLSGSDSGTQRINPAAAGAWQVTVQYTNFTGNLTLGIAKHAASSTTTTSSSGTTTAAGTTSSASGTSSSHSASSTSTAAGGKKKSPGVEPALLALALVALGVALRRRLPPN